MFLLSFLLFFKLLDEGTNDRSERNKRNEHVKLLQDVAVEHKSRGGRQRAEAYHKGL